MNEQYQQPAPPVRHRTSKALGAITVVVSLLAIGASVVALLALSEARKAQTELDASRDAVGNLGRRLTGIEGDIETMQGRLTALGEDATSVRFDVDLLVGPVGAVVDLASRIDTVQSSVDDLNSALFSFGGFGLVGAVDNLTSCLNDYMDTVAGGFRRAYSYC